MIDFTSEEGIMDAIDKFFHLSQEEKENYNKGLKVDKANTLSFLYMFHEVFYPDKDYDEQKLFTVANFIKMFNYDLKDNMVEGFVKVSITKGLVLNGKFDSWIISTPRHIEVFRQLLEYSESFKIEACDDNDCRFEFEIKELV